MKKMLAAYCCILFLRTFAQAPQPVAEEGAVGKKVLIKAIALIVNAESAKKIPEKKIFVPTPECPIASRIA